MTRLYWLEGPWRGKLALAARPRGGDWLKDDIGAWKREGIEAVLSLLTAEEEKEFTLDKEKEEVRRQGLAFLTFPIPDREVPRSEMMLAGVLEDMSAKLSAGKNILVHCRQGVGRTGLVAASLLVKSGMSPGAAIGKVSAARGVQVPETPQQRDWIERYAAAFSK